MVNNPTIGAISNVLGGTNFGDNSQTVTGSGWTGPVWYGIIPFWIPTKVLETFGTTITKDKRNADKSIASISEGETQLTLVGYLKGPMRRFWKEMLTLFRKLQLEFALAYRRYNLPGATDADWTPTLNRWWTMRFPFISPLATEPDMYIKSLMFTHGAEQTDSYEFILYLERIQSTIIPPDTAVKGQKFAKYAICLSILNTILSGAASYYNSMATTRQSPWDGIKNAASYADLIEVDSRKVVPEVSANEKLIGNSYYPGFDKSRTWYEVFRYPERSNSRMFHFTDTSKIYRLSYQVVSTNGAANPDGTHFVVNAQLEVTTPANQDTWSLVWSGRVAENVTYSYSDLRFGFRAAQFIEKWDEKTWVLDQQNVEAIASVR